MTSARRPHRMMPWLAALAMVSTPACRHATSSRPLRGGLCGGLVADPRSPTVLTFVARDCHGPALRRSRPDHLPPFVDARGARAVAFVWTWTPGAHTGYARLVFSTEAAARLAWRRMTRHAKPTERPALAAPVHVPRGDTEGFCAVPVVPMWCAGCDRPQPRRVQVWQVGSVARQRTFTRRGREVWVTGAALDPPSLGCDGTEPIARLGPASW